MPAPWAADLRGEARIPHYRHRPQRAGSGRSGGYVVVGGELAPTKRRFSVVPAPAAGLDVVDCCTSEHAGLAFLVDPIKAARGGCITGDIPCAWRHFAVEALCATMCLLPPSTVYAAMHGCLCGPLLLRRAIGPYKRCGSERSAGVATVEREHAWSGSAGRIHMDYIGHEFTCCVRAVRDCSWNPCAVGVPQVPTEHVQSHSRVGCG